MFACWLTLLRRLTAGCHLALVSQAQLLSSRALAPHFRRSGPCQKKLICTKCIIFYVDKMWCLANYSLYPELLCFWEKFLG